MKFGTKKYVSFAYTIPWEIRKTCLKDLLKKAENSKMKFIDLCARGDLHRLKTKVIYSYRLKFRDLVNNRFKNRLYALSNWCSFREQ